MGYFDQVKEGSSQNKILVGVIAGLLLVNLLEFKGLMTIAENKAVNIQVPQFMEKGTYVIGSTFASENVYKMWGKTWITDIGNYSYEDIDQKVSDIYPFLASETAFENKSKLIDFATFVKNNFVTQSYDITDIKVKKLDNDFVSIETVGTLKRHIGKREDDLSGLKYSYKLICFARNGQIWIKHMETYITEQEKDVNLQKRLDKNDFVNFDTKTRAKAIEKELAEKNNLEENIDFKQQVVTDKPVQQNQQNQQNKNQ